MTNEHVSKRAELLSQDDARSVLSQAIIDIKIGKKTDDKLILRELMKAGYWIVKFPSEMSEPVTALRNTPQSEPSDRLSGELGILLGLIEDQSELNPSNYDHDDACRLNTEAVEIATNAMQSLPKAITALRNNTAAVEALEAARDALHRAEAWVKGTIDAD